MAFAAMKPPMRLIEIAASLGVSPSTVSRALHRPELVRDETRSAIMRAIENAGYNTASIVATQKSEVESIGLVVPDIENPFFTVLAKAVLHEIRRNETSLVIADTNEEPLGEGEIVRTMAQRVDGMIIASSRLPDSELLAVGAETPLVLINRELPDVPSFTIDNRPGMLQAVEHLVALGHTKVAYVEGPSTSRSGRERRDSFEEIAKEHGVEGILLGPYAPRFEGGVQAADVAVARDVSAVIAYNDLMAFGVISRLADRGISVPQMMSVIGFDDVPEAAIWSPSLTSVSGSTAITGKMAVQCLTAVLTGKVKIVTDVHRVDSQLVVRGSTGLRKA